MSFGIHLGCKCRFPLALVDKVWVIATNPHHCYLINTFLFYFIFIYLFIYFLFFLFFFIFFVKCFTDCVREPICQPNNHVWHYGCSLRGFISCLVLFVGLALCCGDTVKLYDHLDGEEGAGCFDVWIVCRLGCLLYLLVSLVGCVLRSWFFVDIFCAFFSDFRFGWYIHNFRH